MAAKIKRERFNHNILPELIERFDNLVDEMPQSSKCIILEAALKCYLSLPRNVQIFWTLNSEARKIVKPGLISEAAKAACEDEAAAARDNEVAKHKKGRRASRAG